MNVVRLRGSKAVLRTLRSDRGLIVELESIRREGDEWVVSAYATDEQVAAVRAQGATVDVIMDSPRLAAHEAKVRSQIRRGKPG